MATFGGIAWVDLIPNADIETALGVLNDACSHDEPQELHAWVVHRSDGARIKVASHDVGYDKVADMVVSLMRRTDAVVRAFVALDHDEYGAEHIVFDKRDGVVRRVQHVFVYPRRFGLLPYRAGEPWSTDVPPSVRSTASRYWGRLVDGSIAWAAVADLYGVPVQRVRQAAVVAGKAYTTLGVVGAPFAPWLEALGISWDTGSRERPTQLRPGPAWSEAVVRYALPDLAGRWLVLDNEIIMQPIGLMARGLLQTRSGLEVILHPLYLPVGESSSGWLFSHTVRVLGLWPRFATVEEFEPTTRRMVDVIHTQVLPHFDRYGSLAGYCDLCQEQNADHPNGIGDPHVLHRRAMTEIVLERFDNAAATLSALRRVAEMVSVPWLRELATEADALRRQLADEPTAARTSLLANVAQQRCLHGLPPTD